MNILPAMDLYDGKVVRLYKGNFDEMTIYSEDPLLVAEAFERDGAGYIHIVDLNGARSGEISRNAEIVKEIKKRTSLFVEIGGGIRDMEAVRTYLEDIGADRVIIGTKALTDKAFLRETVRRYGEKIAVGIDVRNEKVSINGWQEDSEISIMDFIPEIADMGVGTIIVTDISKDGTLEGTNRGLYEKILETADMELIASGGVSDMEDILRLKESGVSGAIIGKAYYEGRIDIESAVEVGKA